MTGVDPIWRNLGDIGAVADEPPTSAMSRELDAMGMWRAAMLAACIRG
jgi:hypothetical protein